MKNQVATLTVMCGVNNTGKSCWLRKRYKHGKSHKREVVFIGHPSMLRMKGMLDYNKDLDAPLLDLYKAVNKASSKGSFDLLKCDSLKNEMLLKAFYCLVGTIGGELAPTADKSDFIFVAKNKAVSCISSDTIPDGILLFGILGYLINTKIIHSGSCVFLEEPDGCLHPEWQVILAEILHKLIDAGVYVVLTTHSSEILKYIEVHMTKALLEDRVLLNLATKDGFDFHAITDQQDHKDILAKIKQTLTRPFADLYTAGLLKS